MRFRLLLSLPIFISSTLAAPVCWQSGGNRAVLDGEWKAVSLAGEPAWRLYQISSDRTESNDLAARQGWRLQQLAAQWHAWAAANPAGSAAAQPAAVKLPEKEKAISLFNGVNLDGWDGQIEKYWSVEDGAIRARNDGPVGASTYLFTKTRHRNFRLLLEVRQSRGPGLSTMHSAVAVLGEKITDKGEAFGFRGPLVMFCNDWGIWDANRRNRIEPPGYPTNWKHAAEKVGEWNQVELLVIGDRVRCAANGQAVFDFTDKPGLLVESPIGLQLHANNQKQEYRFRGLILTENPEDRLITVVR